MSTPPDDITLRFDDATRRHLVEHAQREGITVEEWLVRVVQEQLSATRHRSRVRDAMERVTDAHASTFEKLAR